MFHRINAVLRRGTGLAVSGASVTVYFAGTTTKAALKDGNGAAIDNPVLTDADGEYRYYIADGSYDERVQYGSIIETEANIQMYDPSAFVGQLQTMTATTQGYRDAAAASAAAAAASAAAAQGAAGGVLSVPSGTVLARQSVGQGPAESVPFAQLKALMSIGVGDVASLNSILADKVSLSGLGELVYDIVAEILEQGTNVTLTKNDITNKITVAAASSGGASTADTVPPTITSANSFTVAENTAFSQQLGADEAVTWTIVGGSDQSLFTLTAGGLLSMTAKNFEAPVDSDGNNSYVVQVRAADAANNASLQTITVAVTDVAETPTSYSAPIIALSSTSGTNPPVFSVTAADLVVGHFYQLDYTTDGTSDAQLEYTGAMGTGEAPVAWPIPALPAGSTVRWRLRYGDGSAWSPWSNELQDVMAGAATPFLLSTTDKNANITVTNGDRTATLSSGSGARGIRSAAQLAGKKYFEVVVNTRSGTIGIGIVNAAASLSGYMGADANGKAYVSDGRILYNNATAHMGNSGYNTGNRIDFAVDAGAGLMWVRLNGGAWNAGSADPAAGTGGYDISMLAEKFFGMSSDATNDQITINTTSAQMVGAIPSGFTAAG